MVAFDAMTRSFGAGTRFATTLALSLASACGTQDHDTIPPALLDAIALGAGDRDYPGPYGNQIGDIATNVCFEIWDDPKAQGYAADALEPRCLGDFYDPQADSHELLLVNTSAVWCLACRSEYGGSGNRPSLVERADMWHEDGLRLLGLIFQDAAREPATVADAQAWAETYEVDFPYGLDADFEMEEFANSAIQPFNMLIDTRTMTIVGQFEGDQPETIWPAVEGLLRGSAPEGR